MKISVVITAYNEEKNIKECLESVKALADEIVVVDNSSLDKTFEIAKGYTKKVYSQENDPGKIDLKKNFGFSKATGDWILSLDADERVTGELSAEIESRIKNNESSVQGYWIPRKNIIFGKWIKSDMWWPDYQLKLFRRGRGEFDKNQVHRALKVEGQTEKLSNHMIHNNYESISQFIRKLNNYTDIEAENLKSNYKVNWLDAIRFPVDDFVKTFFLQKGYRDGLHGLVLSMLQAFYMEVVFAKLWEKTNFAEIEEDNFIDEVKKELKNSSNKVKYWVMSILINDSKNPIKKAILKTARKIVSSKLSS